MLKVYSKFYFLLQDLPETINKVSDFLGKKLTTHQVDQLADYLHIDNFRKNPSVNCDLLKELGILNPSEQGFVRKGNNTNIKY